MTEWSQKAGLWSSCDGETNLCEKWLKLTCAECVIGAENTRCHHRDVCWQRTEKNTVKTVFGAIDDR